MKIVVDDTTFDVLDEITLMRAVQHVRFQKNRGMFPIRLTEADGERVMREYERLQDEVGVPV